MEIVPIVQNVAIMHTARMELVNVNMASTRSIRQIVIVVGTALIYPKNVLLHDFFLNMNHSYMYM